MKVAILVFGQYGEFDTAVNFWDFKDRTDCDFYFSTWNRTSKFHEEYNSDFNREVSIPMITNYIPNAVVHLGDETYYNQARYGIKDYDIGPTQEKIIYHWKTCLNAVKMSGKQYDHILLIRPDMIYKFKFPFDDFFNFNENNKIYNHTWGIVNGEKGPYVNDTFFFGNFETMSRMIELFDDISTEKGNHWDTASHILSLGITVQHIDGIDAFLLRPNVRLLKDEEKTLENCIKSFDEWMARTVRKYKVAVLLYGQLRELNIGVKSWKFKDKIDCDFYVSTWDKTKVESGSLNVIDEVDVTEEDILKSLPNAKISIVNETDFFDDTQYPQLCIKPIKVAFHMKNALRMVRESGVKYDFIMLTRSDMFLTFNFPYTEFFSMNKKNVIYGISKILKNPPENELFIIDTFFYGEFETMSNFIRTLPNNLGGMHTELSKHILQLGYDVVPLGTRMDCITIRPNCRELKDEELTRQNIAIKQLEWGSNY